MGKITFNSKASGMVLLAVNRGRVEFQEQPQAPWLALTGTRRALNSSVVRVFAGAAITITDANGDQYVVQGPAAGHDPWEISLSSHAPSELQYDARTGFISQALRRLFIQTGGLIQTRRGREETSQGNLGFRG
jgi:hypothetical protein